MTEDKVQLSVRFTAEGKALLERIADKLGISQTAAMEIAVRRLADLERVELDEGEHPEP